MGINRIEYRCNKCFDIHKYSKSEDHCRTCGEKNLSKNFLFEDISKARKLKSMTQEQVANKLGVSRGWYNRIETGKTQSTAEIISKLCKILDIKKADLFKFKQ